MATRSDGRGGNTNARPAPGRPAGWLELPHTVQRAGVPRDEALCADEGGRRLLRGYRDIATKPRITTSSELGENSGADDTTGA